ncbi:MAG: two-component sensor histidine kinase [Alphaproteobacteria bacterium]|nr:MAG: two-component sensor histidine kinase [Alphaproteobacteria bacterium]
MQKTLKLNDTWVSKMKRYLKIWLNRKTLANRFVGILIAISVVCGLLTYGAITDVPPFGQSSNALIVMLNIDLVILLALVVFVCRRLITLYIKRKQGVAGSNLHIRLVFVFSLLAAVPAIIMAVFSVGFFYFGLHGWLDDRVRSAIHGSEAVANAYLSEHQNLIRADVIAMATDLDREADILSENPDSMKKMIKTQSFLRNFSNVYLFNNIGSVTAQLNATQPFNFHDIPHKKIQNAVNNQVVILEGGTDSIQAFLKLMKYDNLYLYVERSVDPKVLAHVERTRTGVAQYQEIQKHSTRLQILLSAIYLVVTLLLTVAAIWYALSFARRLGGPITTLINASEQVKAGDLSARVDTSRAMDEFKTLGRAFNTMTEQIETQQKELIEANAQMDFRRRFTETILGGVSTGILSLDDDGRVTLANNASGDLLMSDIGQLLGQKIAYLMPEIVPYLDEAFEENKLGAVKNCEITLRRRDESVRTFLVRIVVEKMDDNQRGAILTFDDLTTVLATQRKAAWADIARRIAHEIKNPLTPIQLSAERLNRKYGKSLSDKDRAVFDQCTDTIIRHVGDIKTMVNSFADFAKMPDAVIKAAPIMPLVREILELNKTGYEDVQFSLSLSNDLNENTPVPHDEQQIRQVLTNLIKNAVEAMEGQEGELSVALSCYVANESFYITINDNGPGLPQDNIEKLIEPYVTHKPKGTGLGLAIVKKIIEDHDGQLLFTSDLPIIEGEMKEFTKLSGAFVTMALPYQSKA